MSCAIKNNEYFATNGQESILYKDLENKVGEAQARDLFVLSHTPQFKKQNPAPYDINSVENGVYKTENTKINFKERVNPISGIALEGIELDLIQTDAKARGKGSAKIALQEFLAYTDSLKKDVYLTVSPRDKKTIEKGLLALYKNNGFVQIKGSLEMIRYRKPSRFDKNGEIKSLYLIEQASLPNEVNEELTFVEKMELTTTMTEFPYIKDSEEFLGELQNAFYKEGVFSPSAKSLSKLYSKFEIASILSDVEVMAKIKESIEKLKRTDNVLNRTSNEAVYKTNILNSFGKLSVENPYIIDQDIIEEYGGIENPDLSEVKNENFTEEELKQYKRIPVINEEGSAINQEIIYENAVKIVEDNNVFEAINAIEQAPSIVDTSKLKSKLSGWLLNYGIDVTGFTKDLLPSLKQFLQNPTKENVNSFSEKYREVFNKPVKQREKVLKIEKKERALVYLETNKTEQQLFDELNLLQTETPNIYHRIEKVDFDEMVETLKLDKTISELQAYKDYFNYNATPNIESQEFSPITLNNSLEYLTNTFIADFAAEKLKNKDNSFYNKFIITEKGIELKYGDPISIAEIKAYIQDGVKLGKELEEYSVISKQMPNFKEQGFIIDSRATDRVKAVNNFNRVKLPKGEVVKVNNEMVAVKNETQEFLNIDNQLYELLNKEGNMSMYGRIEKNENLLYNKMNPKSPNEYLTQVKLNTQTQEEYNKVAKKWNSKEIIDSFSCV